MFVHWTCVLLLVLVRGLLLVLRVCAPFQCFETFKPFAEVDQFSDGLFTHVEVLQAWLPCPLVRDTTLGYLLNLVVIQLKSQFAVDRQTLESWASDC